MVGKNPKVSLAELTRKYLGKPFTECGCLDLAYHIYRDVGIDVPKKMGKWGIRNYRTLFKKNKKLAIATMIRSFKKLGVPGSKKDLRIYDLLIVYQSDRELFPAVYVGNGCAITSFVRSGVTVFKLNELNRAVLVRRML